ncbi:hypothetical protein BOX15_Mlig018569g1, partial [Macrostomum lignano]
CANHCCRCHRRSCDLGCDMIHCDCSACFHACKRPDHLLICPRQLVPCINVAYGCDRRLPRQQLASHLSVCPASIVQCPLMLFPEFVTSSMSVACPDVDGFCRSNFDSALCLSLMLKERRPASSNNNYSNSKPAKSVANNNNYGEGHRAGSEPLDQLLGYRSQGLGDRDDDKEEAGEKSAEQPHRLPSSGLSARILSCLAESPNHHHHQPPLPQLVNHHLAFVNPGDGCPRAHDWRPRGARVCSQVVRRDEFSWHAAQHLRLYPNLSGSDTLAAETVCPLAYLGCTARFTGDKGLVFDLFGHAFARRDSSVGCLGDEKASGVGDDSSDDDGYCSPGLMTLPDELIDRILSYLDSHALLCLRSTCRAMRHRLDDDRWRRGRSCCVELGWELLANQSPTGITGWRQVSKPSRARWFASGQAAFDHHRPGGLPAAAWMSKHLASCEFNQRSETQTAPVRVRVLPPLKGDGSAACAE